MILETVMATPEMEKYYKERNKRGREAIERFYNGTKQELDKQKELKKKAEAQ